MIVISIVLVFIHWTHTDLFIFEYLPSFKHVCTNTDAVNNFHKTYHVITLNSCPSIALKLSKSTHKYKHHKSSHHRQTVEMHLELRLCLTFTSPSFVGFVWRYSWVLKLELITLLEGQHWSDHIFGQHYTTIKKVLSHISISKCLL